MGLADANDVTLLVGMLEGDLASQHAVEVELAREGLDRIGARP